MKKKRKKKQKITLESACEILDWAAVGIQDLEANFDHLNEIFQEVKDDVKFLKSCKKDIEKALEGIELRE